MTAIDEFRVKDFDSFVGQNHMKTRLDVHIQAAKAQSRSLDHVLLSGPPGFGKTSLASIIASRLGKKFEMFEMPISERKLLELARNFHGVVLFDEIHRAPVKLQESLLPLLEFGWVQNSRGLKAYSHGLTIVGATTERQKVIKPLWDRFGIIPDFGPYTDEEMCEIVTSMAQRGGVTLSPESALILGGATGGIPRKARQFVLAARDLTATGTHPTAEAILGFCGVDPDGATYQHREYLNALAELGGLAGLNTLKSYLRLSEQVVGELEDLLLKRRYIQYTERGRELTSVGQEKIRGD